MPEFASVEQIRRRFPALSRTHNGHPVAYFDGPGGTQVPRRVVDAMTEYLLPHNANSQETDQALFEARGALADWIGGSADEIVFGANMTTLTFHLGRALGHEWQAGDVVVVAELHHHANSETWRALAKERGIEVRTVRMRREAGCLEEEDIARMLTRGTRLLAVGAASNALGTINDVAQLVKQAHAVGALAFIDGVHYASHHMADVRAWNCDFFVCSAYKFYGPHVGVLWGRRELLEKLDTPRLEPASSQAPDRLETGTLNHEGIVGAAAAIDFLTSLSVADVPRRERLARVSQRLQQRGAVLLRQLWEGLRAVAGVELYGLPPEGSRTPTLSFTLAGRDAKDVATALAARGIFVSHGDFYASTVARVLGHERDGLVRAGCAAYTTAEEVERLVAGVRGLV